MLFKKRITIFAGAYGSGKSEVSVNCALEKAKRLKHVALADLDIVNPFFRSFDAKERLEKDNIKVIAPVYANTNIDVPALTGEVSVIFENRDYGAVLDIGGDDAGAAVISRYKDEIIGEDYEFFAVVNIMRPFTENEVKITESLKEIEASANLKIDGIINNTNFLEKTTAEMIVKGHKVIKKVEDMTGIPVIGVTGMEPYVSQAAKELDMEFMALTKTILLPF